MASNKPIEVDRFTDRKKRLDLPLMFDRAAAKNFFATFQKDRIEAPSLAELKKKLEKITAAAPPLDWTKRIVATVKGGPVNSTYCGLDVANDHLELSFRRYEHARTATGTLLHRTFEEDMHDHWRAQRKTDEFADAHEQWRDDDPETILPYSDDLWARLHAIKDAIAALRERLHDIVEAKDGGKKLLAFDLPKMLGAGEKR